MKTWVEQFLEEEASREYCPYCMNPRDGKRVCCGEVHFCRFDELEMEDQLEIAKQEWEMAFKETK